MILVNFFKQLEDIIQLMVFNPSQFGSPVCHK